MAALPPHPSLHAESAQYWRRWLAEHCDKTPEIWLLIRKKKSRKPGVYYEQAVEEAVCFGWIDGKMKSVDDDMYLLRFSPRRKNSVWSRSNRERAEKLTAAGKMKWKGLESIEQARANGRWASAYSSMEAPDVPADLLRALARNPLAQRHFQGMSNSHRLMYVRWVLEAKRPQTRERRIAAVCMRAEQNRPPGQ